MAEVNVGQIVAGFPDGGRDFFISNKVGATGAYLADERQAEAAWISHGGRLWREHIDLMQRHSLVNVDVMVPLMRAWKKEGS